MHNKQNARKNKQEGKTRAKSLAWHFKICGGMEMKDQGNKKERKGGGYPHFLLLQGPHFLQYFRIRVPHFLQYLIA